MTKLTKAEIIKETADYYGSNPNLRGYSTTLKECIYYSKAQPENKCAVGRCIKEDMLPLLDGVISTVFTLEETLNRKVSDLYIEFENFLKPEYQGHSLEFWDELQSFHDLGENWDEHGLTPKGQGWIEYLINNWGIEYDDQD